MSDLFKDFEKRLGVLREEVRELAEQYGEEIYENEDCTKEEALEEGISKAEMELREL